MSQMTISILDAARAIHAQLHGSFVNTLIPALSDGPETIEELQHAMRRFLAPSDDPDPLAHWSPSACDEPFDAGICIVDLAARLIVFQSTYCDVSRRGRITFDECDDRKARWIPYSISDEWLITDCLDGWKTQADELKRKRLNSPRRDTRAVLYGKLAEFIVDECFAARGGATDSDGVWTPSGGWQWRELPDRASKKILITDAMAEIHARWLMTPRDELDGQSPRQVLHAERSEITQQLEDRELQWSYFGKCPNSLWRESIAYRFGGFGIHENVVYYELVRHLLNECWDLVVENRMTQGQVTREMAIDKLSMAQQEWLHTPQPDYSGKSPAQVIESERLRVPMGMTGKEAIVDCDCPICQMMAESDRPSFWHLDSSHMDDDFPFALFEDTREDWEATREEWGEQDRKWERDRSDRPATDEREKLVLPDGLNDGLSSSIWQRSFVHSHPSESPTLTLFGLGCHLGELVDCIRSSGTETIQITGGGRSKKARGADRSKTPAPLAIDNTQYWIDSLNRDFANLRQAVTDPASALVAPVASKFTEHLLALAESRPSLRAKCLDLDRQLFDFVQRLTGEAETRDDVPY